MALSPLSSVIGCSTSSSLGLSSVTLTPHPHVSHTTLSSRSPATFVPHYTGDWMCEVCREEEQREKVRRMQRRRQAGGKAIVKTSSVAAPAKPSGPVLLSSRGRRVNPTAVYADGDDDEEDDDEDNDGDRDGESPALSSEAEEEKPYRRQSA